MCRPRDLKFWGPNQLRSLDFSGCTILPGTSSLKTMLCAKFPPICIYPNNTLVPSERVLEAIILSFITLFSGYPDWNPSSGR